MEPTYEVFALRYATSIGRTRRDNFLQADAHDAPMPMDYFVWAIRGGGRTVVVDTGFNHATAERRGRAILRDPGDALRAIGIDPATVTDVVLTHLHYDHAGNLDLFPAATFHIQDSEVSYATGRSMCHACLSFPFEVEDVVALIRRVYAGRVRFHDGAATPWPGISLHAVGGHTAGLQVVRVHTARGWLLLGSDAFHYTENRVRRMPFPLVLDVGRMLEGYLVCEALGDGEDMLIPGHDPEVLRRWPAVPGVPDAVRLDLAPVRPALAEAPAPA